MPCLLPKYVDILKEKFNSGELNPQILLDFPTSKARHEYFAKIVGEENAGWVNAAFESKIGLKWQESGITGWAENLVGIAPESKRDMLSRVQRMEKILTPTEREKFLADLTEQRLGVGVSVSEAAEIVSLSKITAEKRNVMESGKRRDLNQPPTETELAYGRAYVEFNNYIKAKKEAAQKQTFWEAAKPSNFGNLGVRAAGIAKSIKATLDNSVVFRQGIKPMWTHPKIFAKNAIQTYKNIIDTFGGKPVMDELMADIVSRPTYNQMKQAELAVGNIEEEFPGIGLEKLPVAGKVYKAAEVAFTAFQYKIRADIFDNYIYIAEKSGIDTNNKDQLKSIGKMVNSLGARGHLGRAERAADVFNNIFFSPRFFKSNVDMLTAHLFQKDVTPFVRKQAAINTVKVVLGTASLMAMAKALGSALGDDDVIEFDPRSANFGKIKINDTRFDITGGMGSLVTLASRIAPLLVGLPAHTKSSTTGKMTQLNKGGFAGRTGMDVLYDFFEGKLSPTSSVVLSLLKGERFGGEPLTPAGIIEDVIVPLPISNIFEDMHNPNKANLLLTIIADHLGVGANTYSAVEWFDDKQEKEVSEKYNISTLSKDEFADVIKELNQRGYTISDPKKANIGNRELTGDDLKDYRIYRQLVIRRKLSKNRDRIKKMTDTALERFINSVNLNATEETNGKFKKYI